ncbi:MAG: thioredoxin domain-containing protein [Ignavibacteriales bacterium]|nr:thioredoxin domain-containing protein [Ignavibacteriales bacterium]
MLSIIGILIFFLINNIIDNNHKPVTAENLSSFAGVTVTPDSSKENTIKKFIAEQFAKGRKPNRLIKEKSPYLLQHAFNPVDWYSWGEEAFEKARREGKPIFLSVGYSTCYWCHVMEREVFENDSIAGLMNKYVIAIKVDREERPDVDRVYMTALQAMTGGGGWPMSIFLTPDLKPFYGATYIPPKSNYGKPGFPEVLEAINDVWTKRKLEVIQSGTNITEHIKNFSAAIASGTYPGLESLEKGYQSLENNYDEKNGGFNKTPKFPRPVSINFLLRYYKRTGNEKALEMSLHTLTKMAEGGIYDHIGGGFHRYATDELWRVPHFEKMLYDQALLVNSYLESYQITHNKFYADLAKDILGYVERNMTRPGGGFYSAEDAESSIDNLHPGEKEEGAFYTWHKNEIDKILGTVNAKVFNFYSGIEKDGNVNPISNPRNGFKDENILYRAHSIEETAKEFYLSEKDVTSILSVSREKIFWAREQRPKPHIDDKLLASWNGLMISAFARAYQVFHDDSYLLIANKAANFLMDTFYDSESKQFFRRYRDGEVKYPAHLEDYAFLIQALIDLYEAAFDIKWIEKAIELTAQQINLFYDYDDGGFYDTSGNDPSIIIRTKEFYDDAEPSGNSIAILNLLRLSQMTDNEQWRKMAEKSLSYFGGWIKQVPQAMPQLLAALDFSLSKPKQIIIAGSIDDNHTKELLNEVHSHFVPNKIILLVDKNNGQKKIASFIPFVESIEMINGIATAYICENYACKLPTTNTDVVAKLLNEKSN